MPATASSCAAISPATCAARRSSRSARSAARGGAGQAGRAGQVAGGAGWALCAALLRQPAVQLQSPAPHPPPCESPPPPTPPPRGLHTPVPTRRVALLRRRLQRAQLGLVLGLYGARLRLKLLPQAADLLGIVQPAAQGRGRARRRAGVDGGGSASRIHPPCECCADVIICIMLCGRGSAEYPAACCRLPAAPLPAAPAARRQGPPKRGPQPAPRPPELLDQLLAGQLLLPHVLAQPPLVVRQLRLLRRKHLALRGADTSACVLGGILGEGRECVAQLETRVL